MRGMVPGGQIRYQQPISLLSPINWGRGHQKILLTDIANAGVRRPSGTGGEINLFSQGKATDELPRLDVGGGPVPRAVDTRRREVGWAVGQRGSLLAERRSGEEGDCQEVLNHRGRVLRWGRPRVG